MNWGFIKLNLAGNHLLSKNTPLYAPHLLPTYHNFEFRGIFSTTCRPIGQSDRNRSRQTPGARGHNVTQRKQMDKSLMMVIDYLTKPTDNTQCEAKPQ